MEIIVTSYKDRRKSPCEVAVGFLRNFFERLTDLSVAVNFRGKIWLECTSFL
jgi:hypothetical protein